MRKLACFALPFSAAILLCCYLLPAPWQLWLGPGCAAAAGACLLLGGDRRRRGILLCLGAAAGFLWFRGWTAVFCGPADALAGRTEQVSAAAADFPEETVYGVRVEVRIDGRPGVTALLYAGEEYAGLRPGDRVRVTARFQPADVLRGDPVSYYTGRGIFLLAYAEGELEMERPDRPPLWVWPAYWRRALRESLARVMPEEEAGLAAAVTLGGRGTLSGGDSTALSRSGLSHLAAVSGLHVGFLAGIVQILCRKHRRRAALTAIPVLVLFALTVGGEPPVVRAVVMQTILLLAPVFGRDEDGPTSLSLALLLLLLQNPYAAASAGLQLSFAAVEGIQLVSGRLLAALSPLYAWEGESPPLRLARKVLYLCCAVFAVTLGALLFTTPLTVVYFNLVSLAAPLANLLAFWAVSGLFVFGLLAALAGLVYEGLGAAAGLPAVLLGRWVLWLARTLGRLPFAAVPLSSAYYRLWLAAVYCIIGAVFVLRRERLRPIVPVCGGALTLSAAILFTRLSYTAAPLTVSALDVGQGASIALISDGRAALIDCGGNGWDNAGDTAADYFQSIGISRLDLLVLTHFDSDHFNGVEQLFQRLEVTAVAVPRIEDPYGRAAGLAGWAGEEGAHVWYVDTLSQVELGQAVLTLYPPLGRGTSNEEGLIALCSVGECDVLITGDADSRVEAMLVKYFDVPDVELLIVGHHGSGSSTSAEFLAAVRPEHAIISTGCNTYGHPAPETLERLVRAGVSVRRTDQEGTVTVYME